MKIDIITSVTDGLAEKPILKIDGEIVYDFNWYAFDWDGYDGEDTCIQAGQECTCEEAHELHSKIIKGQDNG